MVEKAEVKPESLLNLDDLLQCPVCYEIPTGQIFQCNEGHHVCGRCKMRLDVCPVCRALFFGTRNYAMEELIANFRKVRSFKLGGKASGSGSSESSTPAKDTTSAERENEANDDDEDDEGETNIIVTERSQGPPQPCSGLFRCLCCKTGNSARLPSGRLLNHLRYFHAPDLLEGRSENGEYLQAWQFATVPGKLVTAVRISDMGIFFLTIEITSDSVCAWLSMAASPWVAHEFSYTITICGNDREAIFSDCVWSVRSCEGALKKRGHCLIVKEQDAEALTAPSTISGKLSVRRTPADQLTAQSQPRAVLRIANRVNNQSSNDLEPFLQELQDDVARLSRAFATLGREANALVHSEAQMRARIENFEHGPDTSSGVNARTSDSDAEQPAATTDSQQDQPSASLSRNARRRLKQRMRAALDRPIPPVAPPETNRVQAPPAASQPRQNVSVTQPRQNTPAIQPRQPPPITQPRQNTPVTQQRQNTPVNTTVTQPRQNTPANTTVTQPRQNTTVTQPRQNTPVTLMRSTVTQTRSNVPATQPRENGLHVFTGYAVVTESPAPVAPPPVASSSSGASQPQAGNGNRNKKKRRHRR